MTSSISASSTSKAHAARSRSPRKFGGFVGLATALMAIAALGPRSARAQQIPPPETGTATVNVKLVNAEQIEIRDARTNAPIVLAKGQKLVEFLDPAVKLNIKLQPQPTGADVIMTFRNTSEAPKGLGIISMGILTLGPNVTYQDLRQTNEAVQANVATYVGKSYTYPADMYCPAWVVSNSSYHVGVSLQYPILLYKHDVNVGLANPKGANAVGEGGPGWGVNFLLSSIGTVGWQRVQNGAEIQPGEQRTYVMSIRVRPTSTQWVRTLLPYRSYFRSLYGGVKYERNPTPVLGTGLADPDFFSDDNPYGFSPQIRPDRRGFNQFAAGIKKDYPGWGSIMVWAPSGLYRKEQILNYPFQFVSSWQNWPIAINSAYDETNGLASIRKTGKDFGLWWGNSTLVATTWNPDKLVPFDPDNADHVRRALIELDIAAKSGATTIGLDTYGGVHTPVWKAYPWLEFMRLRYPQIRFVTEPSSCDILHTLAPTYITAYNYEPNPKTEDDLYLVKHPNYIADFLLPGHETWASFRYNELTRYFGKKPDVARIEADIKRISDIGYVPVILYGLDIKSKVVAAKTWNSTVPADIRVSDVPIAFGPAAAGSTHVALGIGARADRGSGPVAGWRPQNPSLSAPGDAPKDVASVPARVSSGPSVRVRIGRAGNQALILRPPVSNPSNTSAVTSVDGSAGPASASNPPAKRRVQRSLMPVRPGTPASPDGNGLRKAQDSLFGPPAPGSPGQPAAAESGKIPRVDATDPSTDADPETDWDLFWSEPELAEVPTDPK